MTYVPIKPEELKKLVLMGKKRPMNMAYNPGPKEDDLLIIHKLKAPEVLGRIAKKEGEGPKVAFGTFEITGKKLVMEASQTVPGLAKKLRKFLRKMDFSFKIEVLDIEGGLVDEDTDDDDENRLADPVLPAEQMLPQVEPGVDVVARQKDLIARMQHLQGPLATQGAQKKKAAAVIVALIKAGSLDKAGAALTLLEARLADAATKKDAPVQATNKAGEINALVARAGAVRKLIDTFEARDTEAVKTHLVQSLTLIQSGDLGAAEPLLQQAEDTAKTLPEQAPSVPSGAADRWATTDDALQAKVDAAVAAKQGDLAAIQRAFDYAKSQAEAGDFESACKAAVKTIALLQDAAKRPAAATVPKGIAGYTASRLTWIKTRARMQAELVKLKLAIDQQAGTLEGFKEIARNSSILLEYLDALDTSLETTLEALVETPDSAAREALKSEASAIIASYRDTLDSEFFQAVDDNGFTKTTIRDAALDALTSVETALAA